MNQSWSLQFPESPDALTLDQNMSNNAECITNVTVWGSQLVGGRIVRIDVSTSTGRAKTWLNSMSIPGTVSYQAQPQGKSERCLLALGGKANGALGQLTFYWPEEAPAGEF
jgi:hypothetical protein